MNLLLKRIHYHDEYTVGDLSINGQHVCFTLEDTVREVETRPVDEWKIPGRTAIPHGVYRVDITFSARFHKLLPAILDVPGFSGVRIHTGNYSGNTEGCILVGQTWEGGDWIGSSRLAFDPLFAKLKAAHDDGEAIILEIV